MLFSALGINAANEVRVGRDYMVVLDSQRQVEALTPDITAMLPLGKWSALQRREMSMISSAASSVRGRGAGGSGDGISAQHADPVLE